jgi:putative transposase
MEEIKKQSSKWVKTKGEVYSNFYWQEGYGIFSVNPTDVDKVIQYILAQDNHHNKLTFQEELRGFLQKYNMEYDERYIWD